MASKIEVIVESQYRNAGVEAARADIQRFQRDMRRTLGTDATPFALEREQRMRNESLAADIERRAGIAEERALLELADARTVALERQAAAGDRQARLTLQQLRLESQHAREREKLAAITRNVLVSENTRVSAQVQLRRLIEAQNAELQELVAREMQATAAVKERAAASARAAQATATDRSGGGLLAIGKGVLAGFAALSTVELASKGLGAVVKAMRGDWEGAAEAVERLPLGVGPAIAGISELIDDLRGVTQEYRRQEALARMVAEGDARRAEKIREMAKALRDLREADLAIADQISLNAVVGDERAIETLRRQRDEQIRERRERGDRLKESPADTRTAVEQIDRLFDQQIRALRNARVRAEREAVVNLRFEVESFGLGDLERRLAEAQRQLDAELQEIQAKRRLDEQIARATGQAELPARNANEREILARKRHAQMVEDIIREQGEREQAIRNEINIANLEAQGRTLDADLARIHSYWQERIDAAESGTEAELLMQRRRQAELEAIREHNKREQDERDQRLSRATFQAPTAEQSRFLTGVGGSQAIQPIVSAQNQTTAAVQQVGAAIKVLSDYFRQQNRLLLVPANVRP